MSEQAHTPGLPEQLRGAALAGLHAAVAGKLYAWGHYWADGYTKCALSSSACKELLDLGLIVSIGVRPISTSAQKECFEATQLGRQMYPVFVERGPAKGEAWGIRHWEEVRAAVALPAKAEGVS